MQKGKWVAAVAFASAALVVTLVAGVRSPIGDDGRVVGETQFRGDDGGITLLAAAERPDAPALAGITLDGDQWDLAANVGHVVVLNVWASWCAPCRAEAPILRQASEDLAADGVRFFGINTRDSAIAAKAFERAFGITYPSIDDKDGQLLLRFSGTLNPGAIPSTVVIDQEGRIAGAVLGKVSESTLLGLVEPLLVEPLAPIPGQSTELSGAEVTEDD